VYLKLRDRASYEFALASAAIVITVAGGKVTRARVAWAGLGPNRGGLPRPSPLSSVSPPTRPTFVKRRRRPCATPNPEREWLQIELAKRCLTHALRMATTG